MDCRLCPPRRTPALLTVLSLSLWAVQAIAPAAAHAAFPGANGKIYIVDQATDPDKEIYSIDPDGTGLAKVTDNDVDDGNPAVNAAGTKIAFTRFTDTQHLWTMNIDGTGQTQVSPEGIIDSRIDWSPDGTKIVYSTPGGLKTVNADGTGATALGVDGQVPAWSPDGTRIAYGSGANVFTVHPDGTGVTQITAAPSGQAARGPDWSPDGTKIAFTLGPLQGGTPQIHTINADGTGLANVSNDTVPAGAPLWSPDGTKIAYSANQDVYTMNADGTGKTLLSGVPGFQFATDWAPGSAPAAADIDVDLTAQPKLGILVPYLSYTLTARNTGPGAVTAATVKASLPPGATATGLSTGCSTAAGTVTCTYGAIANGASADKSFRVPLNLLSLGQVSVTGTRTASTPADPVSGNDSATATCNVVSVVLAACP
ncbi:DUF11 domain-containing protein [Actinomadura macrotermitis]|uniref:Protein TolB n=1 Tax=Actinomadura macrotermitis TaxID=2585200 RepID=A0A7K0C2L1_9ACTN|nr:DUF11 domain-containing protein [Actinomadura macrotermitis]MQY07660.1 Protein TolB [Actinomadura macrotermitis]